jgi:hypothetical protein
MRIGPRSRRPHPRQPLSLTLVWTTRRRVKRQMCQKKVENARYVMLYYAILSLKLDQLRDIKVKEAR